MQQRTRVVTKKEKPPVAVLPEWSNEPAMLVTYLVESGIWAELAGRVRIQRVGYAGIDIALFFLLYFGSALRCGVTAFCERAFRWSKTLAALGERRGLPTQASISRCLSKVSAEGVSSLGPWLLTAASEATAVLAHPAAKTCDTLGQPWDMIDWDGTNTVLRHRALPTGADLPEAERRSEQFAGPGYAGRKRGDVQVSRATLQHAGTGLWLDVEMLPGRADTAAICEPMLARLADSCNSIGLQPSRCILRADGGAGGGVPWMSMVARRGFSFITRSAHYGLLSQTNIQQHLRKATWYEVPSSGSGPQRQCTDVGQVTLEASQGSDSITVRMVVSRFKGAQKRGAGTCIDGWQYELFATELSPSAWPAPELVEAYYGRCGQENRFYQEDQELELDRIYSYHLPGQQLITLFGLWVWNMRICWGFKLSPPPQECPERKPRMARAIPSEQPTPTLAEPCTAQNSDTMPLVEPLEIVPTSREALSQALDELPWETIAARLPGPSRRSDDGTALVCPQGTNLVLTTISDVTGHNKMPTLKFAANDAACSSCSLRAACGKSTSPHFIKRLTHSVPQALADRIRPLLTAHQQGTAEKVPLPTSLPGSVSPPKKPATTHQKDFIPAENGKSGPFAISEWRLLPAEFRHFFRAEARQVEIQATIAGNTEPPPLRRQLGLATTQAQRQKRRKTWSERHQWNALPANVLVHITITGDRSDSFFSAPSREGKAA